MNTSYSIIAGSLSLAVFAVIAVQSARRKSLPTCPLCGATKDLEERGKRYECDLCGQTWTIHTPKRFGTYGGADL